MAKANYKCKKCGKEITVSFKPGEKVSTPLCEECKEPMERQFKTVNVGYIEEDDILTAGIRMTYQSSNK